MTYIPFTASLTYYEDPNEILQKPHLESWYDINVWSLIVDHGLCDVIGIETVRYALQKARK